MKKSQLLFLPFITLLFLFSFLNKGLSQPTYDNNGVKSAATSAPITIPAGSDRLLVVSVCNSSSPSTITFNGMNLIEATPAGALDVIFYLPLGSGGSITSNITVTQFAFQSFMAGSFQGIDQATPLGNAFNDFSNSFSIHTNPGNLVISKLGGFDPSISTPAGYINIENYDNTFNSPGLTGSLNAAIAQGNCTSGDYANCCVQSIVEFVAVGSSASASTGECMTGMNPIPVTLTPGTAVPTLSQWGLIILSLLMMSIVMVFSMAPRMALAGGQSIPTKVTLQNFAFDKNTFFKMWAMVAAITALGFFTAMNVFGYELTSADPIGGLVATGIVAYMITKMKK